MTTFEWAPPSPMRKSEHAILQEARAVADAARADVLAATDALHAHEAVTPDPGPGGEERRLLVELVERSEAAWAVAETAWLEARAGGWLAHLKATEAQKRLEDISSPPFHKLASKEPSARAELRACRVGAR